MTKITNEQSYYLHLGSVEGGFPAPSASSEFADVRNLERDGFLRQTLVDGKTRFVITEKGRSALNENS